MEKSWRKVLQLGKDMGKSTFMSTFEVSEVCFEYVERIFLKLIKYLKLFCFDYSFINLNNQLDSVSEVRKEEGTFVILNLSVLNWQSSKGIIELYCLDRGCSSLILAGVLSEPKMDIERIQCFCLDRTVINFTKIQ